MRAGIVSYLNAQPLLRGIQENLADEIELVPAVPSALPQLLASGAVDLALLPVAAMASLPGARTVGRFGIAAQGPVASVALFSQLPLAQIDTVVLDHESCTSVALARLLLAGPWQRPDVRMEAASAGYIDTLAAGRAGVVIGDRALALEGRFAYKWDLAEAWTAWTGLPFVFAAWASLRDWPAGFVDRFDAANERGLAHIPAIAAEHAAAPYDVAAYFGERLRFRLDARMQAGLALFLQKLAGDNAAVSLTAKRG